MKFADGIGVQNEVEKIRLVINDENINLDEKWKHRMKIAVIN
jgi:hypothetical protein